MAVKLLSVNLIQQFVNESTNLYAYTSSENMLHNPTYNSKHSIKLGKSVDKIVKSIINSCQ